jgi:hypothetical protein
MAGAVHHAVAVALDPAVDRVGATGGECATREYGAHQRDRRQLTCRQDHRGQRRDEQQLDDPGLREQDVGPDRRYGPHDDGLCEFRGIGHESPRDDGPRRI